MDYIMDYINPKDPNYLFKNYKSPFQVAMQQSPFVLEAKRVRNVQIAKQLKYPDPYYWENKFSNLLQQLVEDFNNEILNLFDGKRIDGIQKQKYTDITAGQRNTLLRMLGFIKPSISSAFSESLLQIAGGVNAYQSGNFMTQMQKLSINIRDVPSGGMTVNSFITSNTSRIQSLLQNEITKVANIINKNPTASRKEISAQIQSSVNASKAQADLIARNEVLTLTGELDKQRQQSLGFGKFMWNTLSDEKVRDSHAAFDGQIFDWNALPTINGVEVYPKAPTIETINCRCFISPVI